MKQTDIILARLLRLHPKLIDLTLDRIEWLLDELGRPHDRLPPVIHVAGTNAKGSTIAHLRAFLEAAGKSVHVYTSPHLVRFNERIRLAGELVSSTRLNEALEHCERMNRGRPITYFEITTAAAFLLFSQVRADYLLLEVGLGGRFDTTNVVTDPLGTIITPVSIDHTEFLGADPAGIAREKAGILKPGAPAVIGRQGDAARQAILEEAEKLGIDPWFADQDFQGYSERGRLVYQDENGLLDLPPSNLKGAFQLQNATLAIAATRHFNLPVTDEHIEAGLKNVTWPGRLMPLARGRLPERIGSDQQLWVDGGHNDAGGEALAGALAEMKEQDRRPLILILGTYANKDAAAYLSHFKGVADEMIAISLEDERQSWAPEELVKIATELGIGAMTAPGIGAALERAAQTPRARIVICGSLHLAGQVLGLNETPPV